jgi:hypothetical protein
MKYVRKVIPPTLWQKFVIWLYKSSLTDYHVVKNKGWGIFLVDNKWGGQRMTICLPWWQAFYNPYKNKGIP